MTSPSAAGEPSPALPRRPSSRSRRPSSLSRRTLLRRACLVAGAVPVAAAIDGVAITPRRLVTSNHSFGQAASTDRLRIVQVSDLHVHGIGTLERQLLEQLHDAQADLIVITGDSIDRAGSLPLLDRLLGEFPRSPRVLAILGNWEYRSGVGPDQFAHTYARHGIELLVNQSIELEHHGRTIRITGLDDILDGRPDAATALRDGRSLDHHLVLAHCPVSRDTLGLPPEHPASLVLSGHTHGGQVAPFGVATILPPGCGRYVSGWYRDDGGPPLYVSRGIGTSLLPIRIGAAPELVRIDWGLEDPLQFSAA
jgi:predicted MPP superfamily phosphohydrolase